MRVWSERWKVGSFVKAGEGLNLSASKMGGMKEMIIDGMTVRNFTSWGKRRCE